MRKLFVYFLIAAMLLSIMSGCTNAAPDETLPETTTVAETTQTPVTPDETKTPEVTEAPTETEVPTETPAETEAPAELDFGKDSYWVARTWVSTDGDDNGEVRSFDPDVWSIDLLIRPDGTARLRDIHEKVCLMDDSNLNLTWETRPDGLLLLRSELTPAPVLEGVYKDGRLTMSYMGVTLDMEQMPAPETAGQMYVPAELAGTWLMVSGETEGYQWEAMPGRINSLIFSVYAEEEPLILTADMEEFDANGTMEYNRYSLTTEVLSEPVFEGCGNEDWCVRLGDAAPKDENGFPTETEYYVTLLDYNTLLMQQYYIMDGYPAISCQTYARFPDMVSWSAAGNLKLELSTWSFQSYTALSGEELPIPEKFQDASLFLGENQSCTFQYADGSTEDGLWQLEYGGVLLLRGDDESEDPFWYGGAVSSYSIETIYEVSDTYQMALYYNGGILKLTFNGFS